MYLGGGSLTIPVDGTWFVGVDIFSKDILILPRLGHRGWIPVAKVIRASGAINSVTQITPILPTSRLPRTIHKITNSLPINILVLGSSLAEGGTGINDWSGMLFNSASSTQYYKIPAAYIIFNNFALGGTPNQYQLAELARAMPHTALDYGDSGYSSIFTSSPIPLSRSSMFIGVDLVVITVLANGGDYRMETIEPIIRKLRQLNIEVILTTDDPQGAPFANLSSMITAALYTDGPEVIRIADLYGVELADTAAYVVGATYMYPAATIYRDSIHMFNATPVSRNGQPGGGYEVWARAIRSLLHVDAYIYGTVNTTYNFSTSTNGFVLYGPYGSATNTSNALVCSKTSSTTGQWGCQVYIMQGLNIGDTVVVTGNITLVSGTTPSVGLYYSGWASGNTVISASGAFSITLTSNVSQPSGISLLFFGNNDNALIGAGFTINSLSTVVNSTYVSAGYETMTRQYEIKPIPPIRMVSDLKTPADAIVILPKYERHLLSVDSYKGTLSASPLGSSSFARRFSSIVGASEDLLILVTGQRAALAANGAVGFSLIYYSLNLDPAVTFDVYMNATYQQTITIPAQTISREIYLPIYTPTQFNITSPIPVCSTIDIRCTSGTLRITALIALTFDMDYLTGESIQKEGTWSRVTGPMIPGYATDTANDYAMVKCPDSGNRVSFICAGKPNSQLLNTWSGRTQSLSVSSTGVNHVHSNGNTIGAGDWHYIQLAVANANSNQSTNGYGLCIGGVIITNDR